MILYPAIDLKDGRCVRLLRGDMEAATVFNEDPASQARSFEDAGCRWLHVVDLNGAFAGLPVNTDAVGAVLNAVDIPVQLGGGIRDLATMEHWLNTGVQRIILGTLAVKDPDAVKGACLHFPGRIAVGIDARAGRVAVEGWAEASELRVGELAQRFEDVGAAAIIYTDIDRDGTMQGVNAEAARILADTVSIPIIVSGGVATIDDLKAVRAAARSTSGTIEGVVVGRALYDGGMDLGEALAALED